MKEIIAITNQKGGTGKTTTASALSAGLALKGYRVLSIDLDAQGNFSFLLQAGPHHPTIIDLLTEKAGAEKVIQNTSHGDIIASDPQLVAADFLITGEGREYRLKNALTPLKKKYDFIILDTPPALGTLTVNALTAASSVVVSALADVFSIQGVYHLGETIKGIQQSSNPKLKHRGILITRYSSRSIINRDMADTIREAAQRDNCKVFSTVISEAVAIREAAAKGMDIFSYSSKSRAAVEYGNFIDELLQDIK